MRRPARGGLWASAAASGAGALALGWARGADPVPEGAEIGAVGLALVWSLLRLGLVGVLVAWALRLALAPLRRVCFDAHGARVLGPGRTSFAWADLALRWDRRALVMRAGARRRVLWFPEDRPPSGWLADRLAERPRLPARAERWRLALALLALLAVAALVLAWGRA